MLGSPVLEVILAVVGMFAGLGVVCAGLCEWLSSWRGWRSRMLESGLRTLLDDGSDHEGRPLTERFFEGPFILSLAQERARGGGEVNGGIKAVPPHLPARVFTTTVLELIQPPERLGEPLTFNDYARLVERLPDTRFKTALRAIGRASGHDLERVRLDLDAWFDRVMERVSGHYRRRMGMTSLVVSALLCAALGADALALVGTVWGESLRREDLRAAVALGPTSMPAPPAEADTVAAPVPPSARPPADPASLPDLARTAPGATVPIRVTKGAEVRFPPRLLLEAWREWGPHLLGLLLSTFGVATAASVGFDVLNRVTHFRLLGPPAPLRAAEPTMPPADSLGGSGAPPPAISDSGEALPKGRPTHGKAPRKKMIEI